MVNFYSSLVILVFLMVAVWSKDKYDNRNESSQKKETRGMVTTIPRLRWFYLNLNLNLIKSNENQLKSTKLISLAICSTAGLLLMIGFIVKIQNQIMNLKITGKLWKCLLTYLTIFSHIGLTICPGILFFII